MKRKILEKKERKKERKKEGKIRVGEDKGKCGEVEERRSPNCLFSNQYLSGFFFLFCLQYLSQRIEPLFIFSTLSNFLSFCRILTFFLTPFLPHPTFFEIFTILLFWMIHLVVYKRVAIETMTTCLCARTCLRKHIFNKKLIVIWDSQHWLIDWLIDFNGMSTRLGLLDG